MLKKHTTYIILTSDLSSSEINDNITWNLIPETGNVGIGTTSPLAALNIRSSGSIAASDLVNSAILVGTTTSSLGFDRNEIHTVNNDLNIGTLSENRHFYVKAGGNTTRMFVDGNTGNIGIGTSRPEGHAEIIFLMVKLIECYFP